MKKLIVLLAAAALCFQPLSAQKMGKEEKAALTEREHQEAVDAIKAKSFVIVPSTYQLQDGSMGDNDNNDNFISVEGEKAFSQGSIVCDNSNTNVAEMTAYDVKESKKGAVTLTVTVLGRKWNGTYRITLSAKGNQADVIFNQPSGSTLRFSGPVVPLAKASYNKRSNPI